MRWLLFTALVGLLVASGCSSNGLPCCQVSFDSGTGSGTICACGNAGGSIYETSMAGSCTVTYTVNNQAMTLSGTPLASCGDGG